MLYDLFTDFELSGRISIYLDFFNYLLTGLSIGGILGGYILFCLTFIDNDLIKFIMQFPIITTSIWILDLILAAKIVWLYLRDKKDIDTRYHKEQRISDIEMGERDINLILALPMGKLAKKWYKAFQSTSDSVSNEQYIQRFLYSGEESKFLR